MASSAPGGAARLGDGGDDDGDTFDPFAKVAPSTAPAPAPIAAAAAATAAPPPPPSSSAAAAAAAAAASAYAFADAAPAAAASSSGPSMAVEREVLLRGVKRRMARETYCWTLPPAMVSYVLFCASLVLHVQVDRAYEFESGLLGSLLGPEAADSSVGPPVGSVGGVYAYLGGTLVPAFYPDDPASRGRVNTYGALLGGLRLAQARSAAVPCAFSSSFPSLARPCYPDDTDSDAPFGADPEAAAAANVSSAFARTNIVVEDAAKADTLDPFELVIPWYADPGTAAARVDGLAAGGWVDAASKWVHAEGAVLNLDIQAWARTLVTFSFTRGGRVTSTVTVRSLPIDPYLSHPGLYAFDVLNLLYLLVLVGLLLANMGRVGRKAWRLRADGYGSAPAFFALFDAWLLIDWGATLCYLATALSWADAVLALGKLQGMAAGSDWGALPPLPGADEAALAAQTTRLHGYLGQALESYWEAKTAACATLFFLTLRLFWQFSLQPKLAVMTECLSRGASDMLHFGVLFAVIMASYTIWGHVAFGSQVADWASLASSGFAVIRFAMYDYDLVGMTRADSVAASLFFGSFMFFITNMILWMFLAIIIDFYSEVRAETRGAPSALADLAAATAEIPGRLAAVRVRIVTGLPAVLPPAVAAWLPGGGGASGGGSGGGTKRGASGGGRGAVSLDGDAEPDAPVDGAVLAPLTTRISLAKLEETLSRPPLLGKALVTADDLAGPLQAHPSDVAEVLSQLAPFAGVVVGGGGGSGGSGGGGETPTATATAQAGAAAADAAGAPVVGAGSGGVAPPAAQAQTIVFTKQERASAAAVFAAARTRARERAATPVPPAAPAAPASGGAAGEASGGGRASAPATPPKAVGASASSASGGSSAATAQPLVRVTVDAGGSSSTSTAAAGAAAAATTSASGPGRPASTAGAVGLPPPPAAGASATHARLRPPASSGAGSGGSPTRPGGRGAARQTATHLQQQQPDAQQSMSADGGVLGAGAALPTVASSERAAGGTADGGAIPAKPPPVRLGTTDDSR